MSIGKLTLYSGNTESSLPETDALIDCLREIGLIGKPLDTYKNRFLTGENFLHLISFVGCSTSICLAPTTGDDSEFCHLTIKGPFENPRLFLDKNSRPPRCHTCKKSTANWQDHIENQAIKCVECGNLTRLEDISWGRSAGYGRIFIEIYNIFPGEAQPVPDLLARLGNLSGSVWSYFFTE